MTTQEKIKECTSLIDLIENIEFRLIELGMNSERRITRTLKRQLIFKQTELWNELESPILPGKIKLSKSVMRELAVKIKRKRKKK